MSLVSTDYGSDDEDNTTNNNNGPVNVPAPIRTTIQPAKENKIQNNTQIINNNEPDDGKKRKINFVVPLKVIKDTGDDEEEIQRPQKKQKIGASLAQLLPKPKQLIEDKPVVPIKSKPIASPLLGQYDSDEEDAEENDAEEPSQSALTAVAPHTSNVNMKASAPIAPEVKEKTTEDAPAIQVKKPLATAPKAAPKAMSSLRAQMIRAINTKSETAADENAAPAPETETKESSDPQPQAATDSSVPPDPASAEYAAYYAQYYANYYNDPNAYYAQQGYQYDPSGQIAYPEEEQPYQQPIPAQNNMEELMRKNPELRRALESAPIMTVNANEHLGDPRMLAMGKSNKDQTKMMLEASAARAEVSRTGRSRHHISYLVAEFKARELQHAELRAQQQHNKAESRKKYGW